MKRLDVILPEYCWSHDEPIQANGELYAIGGWDCAQCVANNMARTFEALADRQALPVYYMGQAREEREGVFLGREPWESLSPERKRFWYNETLKLKERGVELLTSLLVQDEITAQATIGGVTMQVEQCRNPFTDEHFWIYGDQWGNMGFVKTELDRDEMEHELFAAGFDPGAPIWSEVEHVQDRSHLYNVWQ